jgi:hypothetical protein
VCRLVAGKDVLSVEYGGSSDSTLLDVLRSACTVGYVSGTDNCRVSRSELVDIQRPSRKKSAVSEKGMLRPSPMPAGPATPTGSTRTPPLGAPRGSSEPPRDARPLAPRAHARHAQHRVVHVALHDTSRALLLNLCPLLSTHAARRGGPPLP